MGLSAACDGSALGNPGPAGWSWVIDADRWAAGGWPEATNNQGELQAVIEVLRATQHLDEPLHLFCDSKYVINSVTQWMSGWKRRGWKKADGKPVLNVGQLQELDALLVDREVTFEWVKGHASHTLNNLADEHARAAATAFQRGTPVPTGPGLAGSAAEPVESDEAAAEELAATGTEAPRASEGEADAALTQVTCRLDPALADEIVRRARSHGRHPQEELAVVIRRGLTVPE